MAIPGQDPAPPQPPGGDEDSCFLLFDPIPNAPIPFAPGTNIRGVVADSRQDVDNGEGTCRTLRAWSTKDEFGDVAMAACRCDGEFSSLAPSQDQETGDVIWAHTQGAEYFECNGVRFPKFMCITFPKTFTTEVTHFGLDENCEISTFTVGLTMVHACGDRELVVEATDCDDEGCVEYSPPLFSLFGLQSKVILCADCGPNGTGSITLRIPCRNLGDVILGRAECFEQAPGQLFCRRSSEDIGSIRVNGCGPNDTHAEFSIPCGPYTDGNTLFPFHACFSQQMRVDIDDPYGGVDEVVASIRVCMPCDGPATDPYTPPVYAALPTQQGICLNNPVGASCFFGFWPETQCEYEDSRVCCIGNGCYELPPEICDLLGGSPVPGESECQMDGGPSDMLCQTPCQGEGACCFPDGAGTCLDGLTEEQCEAHGGDFAGPGSECEEIECLPTGACCLPDDTCMEVTEPSCASLLGSYQGDGVPCSAVECGTGLGSCCIDEGQGGCVPDVIEIDCEAMGGVWHAPPYTCDDCLAQLEGVCCLIAGGCIVVNEFFCNLADGFFQGPGGSCDVEPNPCADTPPLGACCFQGPLGGSCKIMTEAQCIVVKLGTWHLGETCDNVECELPP